MSHAAAGQGKQTGNSCAATMGVVALTGLFGIVAGSAIQHGNNEPNSGGVLVGGGAALLVIGGVGTIVCAAADNGVAPSPASRPPVPVPRPAAPR